MRDYRCVIDGYLLPTFGERKLETITLDEIHAYKERLFAGGELSNRTIVRHLTVLHGIFRRAMRVWKLSVNPASAGLVERPPVRPLFGRVRAPLAKRGHGARTGG